MALSNYETHDGLGMAELVRKKKVSPAELVEEAITRIETHNPKINAVVNKLYDRARNVAKGKLPEGPFTGVPFLIKDLHATLEGLPTSHGNRLWKNIPAKVTTELVKRWENSGGIIVGRNNTPEFGLTPYTESDLLGPALNPWDISRTPGGSSGGSGAAVAARMVPFASGGDGGGSIRIPASCCGLFGLKPTRGRTPTGPDAVEYWQGCAVEHVLTRSVRDSAAVLDAVHGSDPGAPYAAMPPARPFLDEVGAAPGKLRIAFTRQPLLPATFVHPECIAAVESAAKLCAELGHEVEEAHPPL